MRSSNLETGKLRALSRCPLLYSFSSRTSTNSAPLSLTSWVAAKGESEEAAAAIRVHSV